MSAVTYLSSSRLGAEARCSACGAGATMYFNWRYAQERRSDEDVARIELFEPWQDLRKGSLYRCRVCQATWHLDGHGGRMTHVEDSRLNLVLSWNAEPISLPGHLVSIVDQIEPTPPDVYGNGIERRVTPCAVRSKSGEVIENAMVCVQPDAPVESWMQFRLGSEIADIRPSANALPLAVRRASSRAGEMRMGFYPSLIEMPDERRFVLNGMASFMVVEGYDARTASTVDGSYFAESPPPDFVNKPEDLVYFIIDGEPGWPLEEDANVGEAMPATRSNRRSWLGKLLRH